MAQETRVFVFTFLLLFSPSISSAGELLHREFGPFNSSYFNVFAIESPAMINNGALQVTPDSAGNINLTNQSGRVMFNHRFRLWEGASGPSPSNSSSLAIPNRVASFNTSFLINIYRLNNLSNPGEGLAFVIAPDLQLPAGSHGQYLGLTNATTDGNSSNHLIAIEFDTFKQDFDPDANHIGLDINGVRSVKNVSLSEFGFQLSPQGVIYFMVWIEYNGTSKVLQVFMDDEDEPNPTKPRPSSPVMTVTDLDISTIVKQHSYFGFAASTGEAIELNCVLRWNLTVENLQEDNGLKTEVKIMIGVGVPLLVILLCLIAAAYYMHKKRKASDDPNIVGTLKCLPGTPREFNFKDLKMATNNFDDKLKLGQGGFGEVYKGVMPGENLEIAVKKFSRDKGTSKDDFLAELMIINRLRHKNLVPLLGWCHKNGMLLLVYEYMPNGSLDTHIFTDTATALLGWNLRCKILSGVASALHYLHNGYNQRVVHRDLKPSNIMLDSDFDARLGDFGLARAIEQGKTSYAELNSPGIPGTMGYIAPECLHTGKATRESDVYAFGAVVLEVVCGQRPWTRIGGYNCLVDWVWSRHREGRILEAVDERLRGDFVDEEAERLLLLGLACSHPTAAARPKTEDVLQIISGSATAPTVPPFRPAFVWRSDADQDGDDTTTTTTVVSSHSSSISIV